MPSRKSPSQRSLGARLSRSLTGSGSHGGRVVSAAPVVVQTPSVPTPTPGGGPVLYVSTTAGGPPTDGNVFWYVTDESC